MYHKFGSENIIFQKDLSVMVVIFFYFSIDDRKMCKVLKTSVRVCYLLPSEEVTCSSENTIHGMTKYLNLQSDLCW